MKKQAAKRQHFIPKFILKKFLNGVNFKIFDKNTGKFLIRGASNSMVKKYFYEHNEFKRNEIEGLLSKREKLYSVIVKRLENKEQLGVTDFNTLMEFRHVTYYRSSAFEAFHNHRKKIGDNDWMLRHDWKSLNAIFDSESCEQDLKKAQLKAIKSVIDDDDLVGNVVRKMSMLTPFCVVFESADKKFIIGDSGSLCWGNEFDGMVMMVLSPIHAIMFPRAKQAIEMMIKAGVNRNTPTIKYVKCGNDLVDCVNDRSMADAFEYYVDPN